MAGIGRRLPSLTSKSPAAGHSRRRAAQQRAAAAVDCTGAVDCTAAGRREQAAASPSPIRRAARHRATRPNFGREIPSLSGSRRPAPGARDDTRHRQYPTGHPASAASGNARQNPIRPASDIYRRSDHRPLARRFRQVDSPGHRRAKSPGYPEADSWPYPRADNPGHGRADTPVALPRPGPDRCGPHQAPHMRCPAVDIRGAPGGRQSPHRPRRIHQRLDNRARDNCRGRDNYRARGRHRVPGEHHVLSSRRAPGSHRNRGTHQAPGSYRAPGKQGSLDTRRPQRRYRGRDELEARKAGARGNHESRGKRRSPGNRARGKHQALSRDQALSKDRGRGKRRDSSCVLAASGVPAGRHYAGIRDARLTASTPRRAGPRPSRPGSRAPADRQDGCPPHRTAARRGALPHQAQTFQPRAHQARAHQARALRVGTPRRAGIHRAGTPFQARTHGPQSQGPQAREARTHGAPARGAAGNRSGSPTRSCRRPGRPGNRWQHLPVPARAPASPPRRAGPGRGGRCRGCGAAVPPFGPDRPRAAGRSRCTCRPARC